MPCLCNAYMYVQFSEWNGEASISRGDLKIGGLRESELAKVQITMIIVIRQVTKSRLKRISNYYTINGKVVFTSERRQYSSESFQFS